MNAFNKKLDEKYTHKDKMDMSAVQSELVSTRDVQLERQLEELSHLSPNSPERLALSPRSAKEIKAELRIMKKIRKNIRLELSEMTPHNIQLQLPNIPSKYLMHS